MQRLTLICACLVVLPLAMAYVWGEGKTRSAFITFPCFSFILGRRSDMDVPDLQDSATLDRPALVHIGRDQIRLPHTR